MTRRTVVLYIVWALLAAPFAWYVGGYLTGRLFYGEVVHATGVLSTRLMMLALAATPLMLVFPGQAVPRWIMRHRRAFGVASFAYAALHTAVYVERETAWSAIVADARALEYATGWIALLIFGLLAATSNDAAVRRLRLAWRRLHRLVYVAALLTFAHWLLVAFDPLPAAIHLAVIAALEAYRVWRQRRIRAAARRCA